MNCALWVCIYAGLDGWDPLLPVILPELAEKLCIVFINPWPALFNQLELIIHCISSFFPGFSWISGFFPLLSKWKARMFHRVSHNPPQAILHPSTGIQQVIHQGWAISVIIINIPAGVIHHYSTLIPPVFKRGFQNILFLYQIITWFFHRLSTYPPP